MAVGCIGVQVKKVGGVRVVATVKSVSQVQLQQHCYDLLAAQREAHQRARQEDVVLAAVRDHPLSGVTPPPRFVVFSAEVWALCGRTSSMTTLIETYENLRRA